MNEDRNVLILILLGDEAHFHVRGFVNTQNMHYCAPVNLEKCKKNHCIQKVAICCIVRTFGIVGPFFFDNDKGESITVTAEHCVAMLQKSCFHSWKQLGLTPKTFMSNKMEQQYTLLDTVSTRSAISSIWLF
jgi:hypothetical protein